MERRTFIKSNSTNASGLDTMHAVIKLIEENHLQIAALCAKYRARRLALIGSAARDDFDDKTSDLDFVVDFDDLTIDDAADRYLGLLVDLEDLFDRHVDVVSYHAIRNPYFRQVVDRTRVELYAA